MSAINQVSRRSFSPLSGEWWRRIGGFFFQGRKFILFLLALPQMRNRCCYFKVGPLFKPSAPRRRPTSLDLSLCRRRVGFNDPAAAVDLSLVTSLPSQLLFLFPPFISLSIFSSHRSTSTSVRPFAKRCQQPATMPVCVVHDGQEAQRYTDMEEERKIKKVQLYLCIGPERSLASCLQDKKTEKQRMSWKMQKKKGTRLISVWRDSPSMLMTSCCQRWWHLHSVGKINSGRIWNVMVLSSLQYLSDKIVLMTSWTWRFQM